MKHRGSPKMTKRCGTHVAGPFPVHIESLGGASILPMVKLMFPTRLFELGKKNQMKDFRSVLFSNHLRALPVY